MTKQEWWQAEPNAHELISYMSEDTSKRKLRLFAVACARSIWSFATDLHCRMSIEAAEKFADDLAAAEQMKEHHEENSSALATWMATHGGGSLDRYYLVGCNVITMAHTVTAPEFHKHFAADILDSVNTFAIYAAIPADLWGTGEADEIALSAVKANGEKNAILARDIFGNPFRSVAIDPVWLAWHDGIIVKLAQTAYDERALPSGELDRVGLGVLADALEEAGCANVDILEHLRSPRPHVRGCWVVDRLLGK